MCNAARRESKRMAREAVEEWTMRPQRRNKELKCLKHCLGAPIPERLFKRFAPGNSSIGDSVMLKQIRGFDWSAVSAGRLDGWPAELKSAGRKMTRQCVPEIVNTAKAALNKVPAAPSSFRTSTDHVGRQS